MENEQKNRVQSTSTTLKECLKDENWLKGYETIKRDTKNRLKNHYYDD